MKKPEDWHCIKLDGSIPYGSPLQKYAHSREALVASLASAAVLLSKNLPEDVSTLSICAGIFAGSSLGRALFNKDRLKPKLKALFGNAHDNLYINKKPNENTIPTKPEHIAASAAIRRSELFRIFAHGFPFLIPVGGVLLLGENVAPPVQETVSLRELLNDTQNAALDFISSSLLATAATHYAKSFSTAWRFNQVVRRDWVITDEPPKQTRVEPISNTIDRWIGSPAPEGATTREALPALDHPVSAPA